MPGYLSHLGVKGVALQHILTLECPGVSLVHRQSILSSFENLSFVQLLNRRPGEVALSRDCHPGHPFSVPIFTEPSTRLLVGVVVEYERKPDCLDILIRKRVQGNLLLQVLVLHSVLSPTQADLELQVDGVVTQKQTDILLILDLEY